MPAFLVEQSRPRGNGIFRSSPPAEEGAIEPDIGLRSRRTATPLARLFHNRAHSMSRSFTRLLTVGFLLSPAGVAGVHPQNPYFSEGSRGSAHQRTLDLLNPAVVLSIACEPGHEDLPTLATLRMKEGAKVVSVYATNGSATPSDLNGESPMQVAGRRREEAYAAATWVGAESFFLNLPDIGIIGTSPALEKSWVADTVVNRLGRAIAQFQPDVILLCRDFRGAPGETTRQKVLVAMLQRAMRAAAGAAGAKKFGKSETWEVQRLFIDRGGKGAYGVKADELDSVWRKSYRQIALEAGARYASLRAEMDRRLRGADRSYELVLPETAPKPVTFLEKLPGVSRALYPIASEIKHLLSAPNQQTLTLVSQTIGRIGGLLLREKKTLTSVDSRVLVTLKNGLEDLRCSLLHVKIRFTCSDSILTERQLFYLRFKTLSADVPFKKAQVVFPQAADKTWLVNETENSRFPLEKPQEFRVITPQKLVFDTPAQVYGISNPYPRTQLSFIVFREDPDRSHNFAYQNQVALATGPLRTVEILTPVVRITPGEQLIYTLMNITRDRYRGVVNVDDSLVASPKHNVSMPRKDFVVVDTLSLQWMEGIPSGDYSLTLMIRGRDMARFTARKFDVDVDTTRKVGLISGMRESPLSSALRRLHVPFHHITQKELEGDGLSAFGTILLDREAVALRTDVRRNIGVLQSWLNAGGHLIEFPQYASGTVSVDEAIRFVEWPALEAVSEVEADTSNPALRRPNRIEASDWAGWVVSRAFGHIHVTASAPVNVLVRDRESGEPLLATAGRGNGRLTVVALDLWSQLLNVHPGTYRILANLISAAGSTSEGK